MKTKKEILYDNYDLEEFHPKYEQQIFNAMEEFAAQAPRPQTVELLEKFCLFLEKEGYMDTDWRDEPPFAIDKFLK